MSVKPTLLAQPLPFNGDYVLHAYCRYQSEEHGIDEFPHEPVAVSTKAKAMRALRRRGWVFHPDKTGTCPKCAKALRLGIFRSAAA